MNRYISGLFAVIIAISLAAFTQPEKQTEPFTNYYFAFDIANHAPTQDNVEDPANWLEVSGLSGCDSKNEMACRIEVPGSATNPGTPRTLKSSAVINTQEFSTDVYFVDDGGSVLQKSNSKY